MITEEEMRQNLTAAGCEEQDIAKILCCFRNGDNEQAMRSVQRLRQVLLDEMHEEQLKIECLDYLAYTVSGKKKRR